jgi:hypothetical protein
MSCAEQNIFALMSETYVLQNISLACTGLYSKITCVKAVDYEEAFKF